MEDKKEPIIISSMCQINEDLLACGTGNHNDVDNYIFLCDLKSKNDTYKLNNLFR